MSNAEARKCYANIIGWRPLGVVLIGGRSIILPRSISIISWTGLHFVDNESEVPGYVNCLKKKKKSILQARNIGVVSRT